MTPDPADELFSIKGAARRIQVSQRTVRRWVSSGLLSFRERPEDHTRLVRLGDVQRVYRGQLLARRRQRESGQTGKFAPFER